METKCIQCGKLIAIKYSWNPEVKDEKEVNFHQFKNTDTVMCEECYKKYQKLFDLHTSIDEDVK